MSYVIYFVQYIINHIQVIIKKSPEGYYNSEQILEEYQSNFCLYNNDFLNKYSFDYLYSLSSLTYLVKKKLSITIILIPFGLIATQTNEHTACFNIRIRKASTNYCLILVRVYSSDFSDNVIELLRGDKDKIYYLDKDNKDSDLVPLQYYLQIKNSQVFIIGIANSFKKRFLVLTIGQKWFIAKQKPQIKPIKGNKEKFKVYQLSLKQIVTNPYPTVIISLFF